MITHQLVVPPVMVQQTAENGDRTYLTPNGDRYESVTSFIGRLWDKDFLIKWRKRLGAVKADSESERTRRRGTLLHEVIENYLLNDDAYKAVITKHLLTKALFLKMKPELNKLSNIRLIETAIYSDELKLAGTPDIIAEYDGVLSVLDNKTTLEDKKVDWITTYWLQTAIYARMFNELYGEMPKQSVILMAVENSPAPQVFIEPMELGQERLNTFLADPVAFQKELRSGK